MKYKYYHSVVCVNVLRFIEIYLQKYGSANKIQYVEDVAYTVNTKQ